MDNFPNFTYRQLAELILAFDMQEGLSPAALGALQVVAQSAINLASQQERAADVPEACANFKKARDGKCYNCGCEEAAHR